MKRCYAHTAELLPQKDWHPLKSHLEDVATLAAAFAESFNAAEWARVAGVLHDVGKATPAFQKYLVRSVAGKARRCAMLYAIESTLVYGR